MRMGGITNILQERDTPICISDHATMCMNFFIKCPIENQLFNCNFVGSPVHGDELRLIFFGQRITPALNILLRT